MLTTFLFFIMFLIVGAYIKSLEDKIVSLKDELECLKWDLRNSAKGIYNHMSSETKIEE